jgi:arabinogalactan oligomer/maltooligosaccharide transport system substrate-binding protein
MNYRIPLILQKFSFPHLYQHLLWLALALILLTACNRNEATPTPVPPPTGAQAAASTGQPAASNGATSATTAAAAAPVATVAPTPTPLTGHVVLWHSWAQAEGDALAAVIEQLKTAQPGIQVDTLFVAPDDLVSSYAAAVAAGSGPDLVLAPNWWLGELVEAKAVLNLDTVVGGNLDASYWPASVAAMHYQGPLYGLPLTYNLVALYVNKNLVPPEGIPADTTALLTAASANPTSGIGLYATLFHTYWGFPAYGAQLLNDQGIAILDQSPGAADYLLWLNTLNNTPGSYVNSDYGMLLDRFKKGEFAYLVDGPWAMADLRTVLGDALSVSPLPAGPAGAAQPWLYSDGLFVNPTITSGQQTLALNVALFFSSDQAGTTLATVGSLLPAARNADLSSTPLLQGFAAQAATAAAMPTTPAMNEVWTYGSDMIVKALTGVAEPPVIVKETTTLINEANGK